MKKFISLFILLAICFVILPQVLAETPMIQNPDNGHWYGILSGDWHEVEDAAIAIGGHLVTINDQAEEDWLLDTFGINTWYWIGFNDEKNEGEWVWSSGEPVTYTNWAPGEPNNMWASGEHYAHINWGSNGEWNDIGLDSPEWDAVTEGIVELLTTCNGEQVNDLVTFVPDPSTYEFTPNGSSTEELIFSDDFERSDIGEDWITGAFCDSDTITIVDGRVQATENCNYIETVQEFSGNLRIEMDLEKVGSSDHSCWDFGVLLKDLNQYSGIIRFDWGGVDGVAIGPEPGSGCGDDVTIPSGVNKGKAIFTYQDGTVGFSFENDDGDIIDAGSVYAGNIDSSRIRIHLAAHSDTPRYVDNIKIYSINGACPEGYVGKFSFDATLTNISEKELSNLNVEVDELANDNLLLTDNGLIGEGECFAVSKIDDYSDGYLSPDEYVDVPFTVCLQEKSPFRFFVNVLGVAEDIPPIPNPISYWKCDEGTGNIAHDSKGTNDGIINGASWSTGVSGYALQFDGSDDWVSISETFIFHKSTDATLAFWMKRTDDAHRSIFWTRGNDSDTNRFNIYSGRLDFGGYGFGFDYRAPNGSLHRIFETPTSLNEWVHIAVTRLGNKYTLYVDGKFNKNTTDTNPDLPDYEGTWFMGRRSGYMYKGFIDEVALFNKALSEAQIWQLYNSF